MKKFNIAFYVLVVFAVLPLKANEVQNERIQVVFTSPESYSDLVGMPEGRIDSLFSSIREAFSRFSDWTLSENHSIEIEVRDIDLPGWYDPTSIDLPKERKFIDTYPPKLEFIYKVRNSKGEIIYSGHRRLIDSEYLDYLIPRDQPDAFYENLIASWSADELSKIEILEVS